MPLPDGVVSIKEYARSMNVSDTAVKKAIDNGYIVKGVYKKQGSDLNGGIYPSVATREWEEHRNPSYEGRRPPAPKSLIAKEPEREKQEDSDKQDSSLAAIKKMDALYKANITKLNFQVKSGELVKKKDVYRELYAKGQELKNNLMALPDRIIDDILAAKTRNESHSILSESIAQALESIATIKEE